MPQENKEFSLEFLLNLFLKTISLTTTNMASEIKIDESEIRKIKLRKCEVPEDFIRSVAGLIEREANSSEKREVISSSIIECANVALDESILPILQQECDFKKFIILFSFPGIIKITNITYITIIIITL